MKKNYFLIFVSVLFISKGFGQVNLTFGLVAQYNFTNQDLTDSGPNFIDLINNNGALPVADRFGNADCAYQFDGVDDYLSAPYNPALTLGFGATISMWFNLNDVNANQVLLGNLSSPPFGQDGGYMLSVQNGQVIFDTWVGSVSPTTHYFLTAGNVQPNQWTNVAVTFMSAQPNNYIVLHQDGQTIDSAFVSDALGTNTNDLMIGAPSWNQDSLLTTGIIDDIKLYNRRVNNAEISAIFNEVVTGVKSSAANNKLTYFSNYNGSFTISASGEKRINQILVSDASGRFVSSKSISGTQTTAVDLSQCARGVYYAAVQTNLGLETLKIVY
jgi:hypothetical protein